MDYKIVNWIIVLLLVVVFAIWWIKPHLLSWYTKWSKSRRERAIKSFRGAKKKPVKPPPGVSEPSPQVQERWIVVHVEARPDTLFSGAKVMELLEAEGLIPVQGEQYRYYVKSNGGVEKLVFSVVNGIEPGCIDEAFRQKETPCITLFFLLNESYDARKSLETMLAVSERLARELDGVLQDSDHSILTEQTRQHLIDTVDRHIFSSPQEV